MYYMFISIFIYLYLENRSTMREEMLLHISITMSKKFNENGTILPIALCAASLMHIWVSGIVCEFVVWKTVRKSCHVNEKGLQ